MAAVTNGVLTLRQALEEAQRLQAGGEEIVLSTDDDRQFVEREDLDGGFRFHGENEQNAVADGPGENELQETLRFHGENENRPQLPHIADERPRAQTQTWRSLYLAERNISRLIERATPRLIADLPKVERSPLIRTVDQAIQELQDLKSKLEAADTN